jgi:hypothetical protein
VEPAAGRSKVFRHPILITAHVFDKLRSIDLALAEFEALLDGGVVIDETELNADALKELVLLIEWLHPLHLVVIVDDAREEGRILTVYEPDPA